MEAGGRVKVKYLIYFTQHYVLFKYKEKLTNSQRKKPQQLLCSVLWFVVSPS